MGLIRIDLNDGKYTALHDEEHGGVTVLRYGEPFGEMKRVINLFFR